MLHNAGLKNTAAAAARRARSISGASSTLGVTFETFLGYSSNAEMKHPEEISELNGKQWRLQAGQEDMILHCVNHSGAAPAVFTKQCRGDANGTASHD